MEGKRHTKIVTILILISGDELGSSTQKKAAFFSRSTKDQEGFETLVLPLETKHLVRALICCDMKLLSKLAPKPKGRDNIVILLHGVPGTGKTSTACMFNF